jgi:prepilin-type N-terminal cleavage/methylation domain-containing protein
VSRFQRPQALPREVRQSARRAFTLIEVITVLVILTITTAIGYTSLTSATQSSYSQIYQGYVSQVTNAEQNFYNEYGNFTPYPSDLSGVSPQVTVTENVVTAPAQVAVAVGATTGDLVIAYFDGTNACQLELMTPPLTATTSQPVTSTTFAPVAAGSTCEASLALSGENTVATSPGGSAK